MSYFIIIRGPLGIGKTTISNKLSQAIKGKHIEIDTILEKHNLDIVDEDEGCIPSINFVKANKIILPETKKLLDAQIPVIIDGNFYHKEQLMHLIDGLSQYTHFVFTLQSSLTTCIKRDQQREKSYGEGAATAVYNLVSKFDYGISIDTDGQEMPWIIEQILSHLPYKA